MAIERCNRCERYVDLDWHVEDIVYLEPSLEAVCVDCLTDDEIEALDGKAEIKKAGE